MHISFLSSLYKIGFFRGITVLAVKPVWQKSKFVFILNWIACASFCASCENTLYLETKLDVSIFEKRIPIIKTEHNKNTTTNHILYVHCLCISAQNSVNTVTVCRGRHRPFTFINPLLLLVTLHWRWACIPRCHGNRQIWLADPRELLEFLIKWLSGFFSVWRYCCLTTGI